MDLYSIIIFTLIELFIPPTLYFLIEGPLIAKSSIVLDVKPWDDETDMAEVEAHVRSITADGLLWGACE